MPYDNKIDKYIASVIEDQIEQPPIQNTPLYNDISKAEHLSGLSPFLTEDQIFTKLIELQKTKYNTDYNGILPSKDTQRQNKAKKYESQIKQQQIPRWKRLQEHCYITLGRRMVKKQFKVKQPQLSQLNFHTRQYIIPQVHRKIEQMSAQNTDTAYIPTNDSGTGFLSLQMPSILQEVIPQYQFMQTIRQANHIIQRTIFQHNDILNVKNSSKKFKILLILMFLLVFLLVVVNVELFPIQYFTMVSLLFAAILILVVISYVLHIGNQKYNSVGLVDRICSQLNLYFNYLNTKSRHGSKYQWVLGEDFYWIQIQINQKKNKVSKCWGKNA